MTKKLFPTVFFFLLYRKRTELWLQNQDTYQVVNFVYPPNIQQNAGLQCFSLFQLYGPQLYLYWFSSTLFSSAVNNLYKPTVPAQNQRADRQS